MKNRCIALITMVVAMLPMSLDVAIAQDNVRSLDRALTGDEPVSRVISTASRRSLVLDSPGEMVGYTEYEYQTNGSTGNRCALDSEGGVHIVWTKGIEYPGERNVYYNYLDPDVGWSFPGHGTAIGMASGAGYIQLALTSDNCAGVVYHESALDFVTYAVDEFPGFGIFVYFDPPDMLTERCYWPYIGIDRNDRIHIVMREEQSPGDIVATLGYTRSVDGGVSWSDLVRVDTITTLSQDVTASPVSDKVAIIYTHPTDLEIQWINDVYYIESENGTDWDWENSKINVTEYGTGGDSLYAYADLAAIYDCDDNLHIIWNAWYASESSVGDTAFLYHYDYGTGIITLMNAVEFDSGSDCNTGSWSMAIAKMSLGVHEPSGGLFAAYTVFDTSDCSAGGYANGEIFMQYSTDNGQTWSDPENLTNSPTPGCAPGDCDSDHWSSLADRVDEELHIMYINDKDAGGMPQNEGTVTDNPVLYLAVPNPLLGGGAGNISGVVATSEGGLFGVPVDLEEFGGLPYGTTATDEAGAYEFLDVPDGDYTISISTPLGYYAEHESQEITIEGEDITVDFELTTVETIDERRGVGFWKHQFYTYILGTGRAKIPMEELLECLGNINSHFNNNPVNQITLYTVDQPAEPMDSLMAASVLLSARGNAPMSNGARKHLMALLLNVVSLRLHQQTAVSEDGATASQAITYCYDLITDDDNSNGEAAKDIAECINDNIMVPEGIIPLSTPDISYKPASPDNRLIPSTFAFIDCYPNPFNAVATIYYGLPETGSVSLSVFNTLGQRVAILFEGAQQAGEHGITWDASGFPSGVYFARLEAGGQSENIKMVLLR